MDEVFDIPAAGVDDMIMGCFGGDDGPVMKVGEEKEIGKQGLKKKLIKEGKGWETPEVGDEVEVHYTGTLLDGTKFDSSRERDTPFKFKLGQDQGIKTMKKGENAVFTIPPELAYGESGSPPTIPPDSTLQFDVELLAWTSVKDICKDGGIFKKILKEGEKWENPKDPDEVLVNYEARLEDGTVVSKSEEVEFTVKDDFLCRALAKAVKTMKKAEKVLLTVKPQYGFGEMGRPATGEEGAVPPNATLLIDLELVSWKTVTEIGNDKKILKKVLKEGEGYERPNEGAYVKVKITGRLQDGTVFLKKGHDEHEPFEFKTDDEAVIDGLDRAVLNMKKGEVALVTIPPEYAFGPTESKQDLAVVPPNSTVLYEVELVSFVKDKESWDLNNEEKIEEAGKKKEEGNALFKLSKYARASKRYEKAAKFIEYDTSFSENEKKQSKQLKITCNLNNAACKLKLKDYKQAEKLCAQVLEVDGTNVNGLYLRAQVSRQLQGVESINRGEAKFDLLEAIGSLGLTSQPSQGDSGLDFYPLDFDMGNEDIMEAPAPRAGAELAAPPQAGALRLPPDDPPPPAALVTSAPNVQTQVPPPHAREATASGAPTEPAAPGTNTTNIQAQTQPAAPQAGPQGEAPIAVPQAAVSQQGTRAPNVPPQPASPQVGTEHVASPGDPPEPAAPGTDTTTIQAQGQPAASQAGAHGEGPIAVPQAAVPQQADLHNQYDRFDIHGISANDFTIENVLREAVFKFSEQKYLCMLCNPDWFPLPVSIDSLKACVVLRSNDEQTREDTLIWRNPRKVKINHFEQYMEARKWFYGEWSKTLYSLIGGGHAVIHYALSGSSVPKINLSEKIEKDLKQLKDKVDEINKQVKKLV